MGEAAQIPAAGDAGTHGSLVHQHVPPQRGLQWVCDKVCCLPCPDPSWRAWVAFMQAAWPQAFSSPTPESRHRRFTDHYPFFENTHISLCRCVCAPRTRMSHYQSTHSYVRRGTPCVSP